MTDINQPSLFGEELTTEAAVPTTEVPAAIWEQDVAKRALDELFLLTRQYKSSKAYYELLRFITCFRFYSLYNAMLIHVQMPGATFVAPPKRWLKDYGRQIRAGARPLVILQPKGPVMFVFDVGDTEPTGDALPLPPEVEKPFEVRKGHIGDELEMVIENAKRDGIRTRESHEGAQHAGSIRVVSGHLKNSQPFQLGIDSHRKPTFIDVPIRYDLLVNGNLSREARYATLVHELAHLYCGHLSTPNDEWWPDRCGLNHNAREFEAESVTYLVCCRAGINNPSEQYLSNYLEKEKQVPSISFNCVMKSAALIETMSRRRMNPRKQKNKDKT